MTRQHKWLKNIAWPRLREEFGGRCSFCMSTTQLEFAHFADTGVMGKGRGSHQRYQDIKRNPGSYTLLCQNCHTTWG